jgi:hypothetical protein
MATKRKKEITQEKERQAEMRKKLPAYAKNSEKKPVKRAYA